jgi:hypothetical protein
MTGREVPIATCSHEHAEFMLLAVAVTFSIWRTYWLVDQALFFRAEPRCPGVSGNQLDYDVAGE